jgi:uncharacterized membrane protein
MIMGSSGAYVWLNWPTIYQNHLEANMVEKQSTRGFAGVAAVFLKATIVGGLVFLLPLVILSLLIGQAVKLASKIVRPVLTALPDSAMTAGIVTAVAIAALVAFAIAAGLFARTRTGKSVARWFENSMLSGVPQYQVAKSMAEGLTTMEHDQSVRPILVSIEEGWQLGYLLSELNDGWVMIFLPQAPTPMSGNIMYFPSERIVPLRITMVQAMGIVKRMGAGSREALQGIHLSGPSALSTTGV